MAKKKTYIIQYRMPLGLENPKINIPKPNDPQEFDLTEGDVALLRQLVPDVICVPAKKAKEEPKVLEAEDTSSTLEPPAPPEPSDQGDDEDSKEDSEEPEDPEDENESEESEEGKEADENDETVTGLAEDFPGRDLLIENGLDSREKILAYQSENDLTKIKGIGASTAEKISAELSK